MASGERPHTTAWVTILPIPLNISAGRLSFGGRDLFHGTKPPTIPSPHPSSENGDEVLSAFGSGKLKVWRSCAGNMVSTTSRPVSRNRGPIPPFLFVVPKPDEMREQDSRPARENLLACLSDPLIPPCSDANVRLDPSGTPQVCLGQYQGRDDENRGALSTHSALV